MGLIFVGIATVIVATGVTWLVTPLVIRLARYLGAVDLPGGRKTHREPMPRIGGLAVFIGFVVGLAFAAYVTGYLSSMPKNTIYWQGLAFAATGLMLVGLVDDLWGLSFQWKFAAQIVAAVAVWQSGFRIEVVSHPLGGTLDLGLFALPLTVLWIVGITNAVNLIDGLDGLAAGVALIITCTVAALAIVRGELGLTAASVALAGALLGFLRYNFNPARIFLGDSGSLFLGFVLAVTSVRGSQKGPTAVAILAPLLVLGLPLLDTGLAVVRRIHGLQSRGRGTPNALRYVIVNCTDIFLPDRGHIHHRLLDLGMSHRGAVLALYGVATMFALAAFALVVFRSPWVAAVLVCVLFLAMAGTFLLLYLRVWRPEPELESPSVGEGSQQAPTGSFASSKSQVHGR